MLVFFFVVVLSTSSASFQTSAPVEVDAVLADLALQISLYGNEFYNGVRSSIENGLDSFENFWTSYSATKINGFDIATAEDNDLVAESIQAIRSSFLDDLAFRKTMASYFEAAKSIVNEELQKYKTDSKAYKCWSQVKPEVIQVIASFTSSMPDPSYAANSLKPWKDTLEADVLSFQVDVIRFIGYPSEGKIDRSKIVSGLRIMVFAREFWVVENEKNRSKSLKALLQLTSSNF
jgi:hypothetical protein